MQYLTNYLCNKLIDQTFRGQSYAFPTTLEFGLFVTQPGKDGSGTEVSGPGYARVPIACSLTEFSGTQGASTVDASSGDVTWNELECMRVLDRKHVVTVKQGAEGYSAADATGVAAWGRVKSGEVTPVAVLDFDISTTGGSGFGQMNTTNVVALGPIAAPSVVITA